MEALSTAIFVPKPNAVLGAGGKPADDPAMASVSEPKGVDRAEEVFKKPGFGSENLNGVDIWFDIAAGPVDGDGALLEIGGYADAECVVLAIG